MPFLGQDWRSPGQSWVKTEEGWKKHSDSENNITAQSALCRASVQEVDDRFHKGNLCRVVGHDMAAKKHNKDITNNSKIAYFYSDKWIHVHKGSTRERHGYCTLGEAFNRLDFSSAIMDIRRFNYIVKILELVAKSQLTSLSGVAQKNYMNILEKVVQKVLEDQQNMRTVRELLQTLQLSVSSLVQDMGKSVLVGNINTWVQRTETIRRWQQQLHCLQISRPATEGTKLTDLPAGLQLNIMQRLSDGQDLVSLGEACPDLRALTEDRLLWKKLCQYHFTERQIRKRLVLSDRGHLEWKRTFFELRRCYPGKEQYSDTLHLCSHCLILFWKDTNHPCTAVSSESCCMSISPQDFLNLFKY
ncbi:F-box only protein 32-like isoform X3 [Megalops cyprinoides]|uniref:F-box only protein 32-like isoform X3 n=1 Tax=Megalops cyprinoides TaxID=118141 RepID=UPI0018650299|nr:F-box only protein 32-like isoform X3 [Megalops cyprinoides]